MSDDFDPIVDIPDDLDGKDKDDELETEDDLEDVGEEEDDDELMEGFGKEPETM